jgi:hypothetical protein
MLKKLAWLLGVLLLVILAGCTSGREGGILPSETATPEPVVVEVTPEQTPEIATPTEVPTVATPTEAPTAATLEIATLVMDKSTPVVLNSYPSPDKQWRVDVVTYDCVDVGKGGPYGYEQLKLVDVAGGKEQVVADQLRSCQGIGAYGLGGLFWSSNNLYFYYTDAREGEPDGCGQYWLRPISRVDTASFKTEQLGGGTRSPDGEKLAVWQGRELVIWDLGGKEIGRAAALFEYEPGAIAWAPDNQSLVYLQYESPCLLGKTAVVRLDGVDSKPLLVLESDKPAFGKVSWDTTNELTLFDGTGKPWKYDLVKQQFIQ